MEVTIAIAETATERTRIFRRMEQTPFSSRQPGLALKRVDERFSYGFDYGNPSGVLLLGNRVRGRLEAEIGSAAEPDSRRRADVALRALQGASIPAGDNPRRLDLWIHLIHGCNLSCAYCYIPQLSQSIDKAEVQGHSMSRELVVPLLSKLFEHASVNDIEEIGFKFAGGEPTLNLALLDFFCRTAHEMKGGVRVRFGMITNGTFDDRAIDLFVRHRINVSISIDGSKEAHDQLRFVRFPTGERVGTFETIFKNVDNMVSRGLKPYLLFTVTPKNVATVETFSELCRAKKLGFRLSLVRLPIKFSSEIIDRVGSVLVDFYSRLGREAPVDMPIERFAKFAEWNLRVKKSMACSTGRSFFALDQAGRVASCQMRLDKTYGNAAEEEFGEIKSRLSNCAEQRILAHPEEKQGACRGCEFYNVCAGGCPQHTRMTAATFASTSPWCGVYGRLLPVYVDAVARQMLRAYDANSARRQRLAAPSAPM